MDFLLGIFTGIAFCFFYGHHLSNQRKKEERKILREVMSDLDKLRNLLVPDDQDAQPLKRDFKQRLHDEMEKQLSEAIAREDFKEAARLRDLMNKA